MIQTVFQQFDSLTSDGCIFQFFSILGRFHPVDSETFSYCAIGVNSYIHTYIHTCTYIHTYIQTYLYTYIHACIVSYIHMYIHNYVHTYTG